MNWTLILLAAPLLAQPATLTGTVVDSSGAAIAQVQVTIAAGGRTQQMESTADGQYSFSNLTPGPYRLSFAASGFSDKTTAGELNPGENATLSAIALTVAVVTTDVNISSNITVIAQAQIRQAETQRLGGLVPNYFVEYNFDAAPLNTRQKFELTWKTLFDPASFVITGITAGLGQARNSHKGFGQGAQGYAKRYGAFYAEFVTGSMIGSVVMPTLFKQDPRYFYKGVGTKRSRFMYAINRSVICRGDNKKSQFCYSSLVSRFGSGLATNYIYPAADRNSTGTVVQNALIGIGADAISNLFQEFIARKVTRRKP